MKKSCFLLLLTILCSSISFAQSLKSISILGDSYSTFEGYLQPDTNSIWYYVSPRQQTDVTSVKQTWWHKFIKENNYRLCVNNSFSGATICNTQRGLLGSFFYNPYGSTGLSGCNFCFWRN